MRFLALTSMLWIAQLQFIEASTPTNPVRVSYRKDGYRRYGHCSVYCPNLDALFVIGGSGASGPEVFSFKTEEWRDPVNIVGSPTNVGRGCHLSLLESSAEHCNVVLVEGHEHEPLEARVIKLSETGENEFEIEWLVNENPERSGPLGGFLYCSTAVKNTIYILGGYAAVSNSNLLTDRFLQVEVSFDSSSGNIVTNWTDLSTSEDANAPPPLAACGLTSTDSDKLVLYGGHELGNEMRYYDITMNQWLQSFQTSNSGSFVRDGPSLTFYDGKVYMYGGALNDGQWRYPRQLYSMMPTAKPQSNCAETAGDGISNEIPLWCMYDESVGKLPYNGVSRHSCAMRESQMVCTFGSSLRYDKASARMVILDLDIMKNHLTMATEEFWIPLELDSIIWIPLVAYVATCIVIGFYLHIRSKQSNVSGNTSPREVLGSPTTIGLPSDSRLEEGKDDANGTWKSLNEDSESQAALIAGNESISGNRGIQNDSEVQQEISDLPLDLDVFGQLVLLISGFGSIIVPLTIKNGPDSLMVFNVLMNLLVAFTVIHCLYWYVVDKLQQRLGDTEIESWLFCYGNDRIISSCICFGWVFVDLAGIAGMSAGLTISWFQAKDYFDVIKDKDESGYLLINFHDNTLFSVLSIPILCGMAYIGLFFAFAILHSLVSGTIDAFTNGCDRVETPYLDENTGRVGTMVEYRGRTSPPSPKNSVKHVESDGVTSFDADADVKNDHSTDDTSRDESTHVMDDYFTADGADDAKIDMKDDHSSTDEIKSTTDSDTSEEKSTSPLKLFGIGSGISMALFLMYFAILPDLIGYVALLHYFCIPANVYFWVLIPCRTVYSQFNEVVVEKERNETSDRTISIRTSITWFTLFALVLTESIALLTFAYLQGQQLSSLLIDGHSIQFILSETWLLWVVCAPTLIAGALGAPLAIVAYAVYFLVQVIPVVVIPFLVLEWLSRPFQLCFKKLRGNVEDV